MRSGSRQRLAVVALLALIGSGASGAADLESAIGRNEVRVYSAPYPIEVGLKVSEASLPERLERLGYRRVHRRPARPGEYFWGHEAFWIYRRPHRLGGRQRPAELVGLQLRRSDGTVLGALAPDGSAATPDGHRIGWVEPLLLAESLAGDRPPRLLVTLAELPEHLWRAVLAAEDARFFEHRGVDARAVARALLKNALAGKVVQGGSTITQQLVKIRDLSPRRSLGRKVSEAARALALEAEHDKTEILQAYLNTVYFGHVDGVGLYGVGAASAAYFGKSPPGLDLGESALLAAIIQGPNRLSPQRHPQEALARQRWVLSRLEDLGWADPGALRAARRGGLPTLRPAPPARAPAAHFLAWLRDEVAQRAPRHHARGRGVVVETTLDPLLQETAETVVREELASLRRRHRRLRGLPLAAALVALDAASGDVLAYVGGDPAARGDAFDRARRARRQPGSTVKPLVLLEAFEECGSRAPLYPARRVSNRPLRLELPSGPWEPANPGDGAGEVVDLRRALSLSLNIPFVRAARWCGFDATAGRMRRAGLELPPELPPSFVLGSVETTPLRLAAAFAPFSTLGRRPEARPVRWIGKPGGRRLARPRSRATKVSSKAAAYLVRDLLEQALAEGTARAGRIEVAGAYGKTGTSSGGRDAWFAGGAGSVVAAVWVGVDDGSPLGLSGAAAAAPIWRRFLGMAAAARPLRGEPRPHSVVERWIEDDTGLLVAGPRSGAHRDLFRRGDQPRRRRLLLPDRPVPAIE